MKKAANARRCTEMLKEYYFHKGERGKYAKRYAEVTNVVILDPELAKLFPDSNSVNEALKLLVEIRRAVTKKPTRAQR